MNANGYWRGQASLSCKKKLLASRAIVTIQNDLPVDSYLRIGRRLLDFRRSDCARSVDNRAGAIPGQIAAPRASGAQCALSCTIISAISERCLREFWRVTYRPLR